MSTRILSASIALFAALALAPSVAWAQGSIAGVVADATGGVLPGVTVEARSPALIEQVRVGVSDGAGQYRIIELPPGTYSVRYLLPGFTTLVRDGIVLAGSLTATLDVELQIGSLEETVTVSGDSPIIDVSTARRQQVLDDEIIQALPGTRSYRTLVTLTPSIYAGGAGHNQIQLRPSMMIFTSHGGRGNEGRMQLDGLNVGAAFNGGGVSAYTLDTATGEEVTITTSGGLGEAEMGGAILNVVPRTGGNTFSGSFFASNAGEWSQGDNIDAELEALGITAAALINNWDVGGAIGGPLAEDRLWFYLTLRSWGEMSERPGMFGNLNAGDLTKWTYEEDRNLVGRLAEDRFISALRLTAQVAPRHKVGVYFDYQAACNGSAQTQDANWCRSAGPDWVGTGFGNSMFSPEAVGALDGYDKVVQATWTSPMTDRLLIEAGFSSFFSRWGWMAPPGAITGEVPVLQIVPSFKLYRAQNLLLDPWQNTNHWRASASYVTGSHNLKIGHQGSYLRAKHTWEYATLQYTTLFGSPRQLVQRVNPWTSQDRTLSLGFYTQDQWTRDRLTLQGAMRYDYAASHAPAGQGLTGAARFLTEPVTFPRTEGVRGYHDLTARGGLAYDLFGDGRTSFKVNVGQYLEAATPSDTAFSPLTLYDINNPAKDDRFVRETNRSWVDGNGNWIPDCDLLDPGFQNTLAAGGDLCGPWANQNFGGASNNLVVNPDVLGGWGIRPRDWQLGVSIQHEVLPRTSVEVGYHRRWFHHFFVTDNRLAGPDDYDPFTVLAPVDERLPGGGGYPVTEYDIRPDLFGLFDNYYTFASDFGPETHYWHGVDVEVNARFANGPTFQGGTSTGRGVNDVCDVRPLIDSPSTRGCRVVDPWQTRFKGLVTYVIPGVDVLLSGTVQLKPFSNCTGVGGVFGTNGVSLSANVNFPNAQVEPSLGRPLSGSQSNVQVDALLPGELYGDRINQVDLRVGKILRFGDTRWQVAMDLYNLFNSNVGLAYQQNYGAIWLNPTQIMLARLMRWNLTVDW